MDPSTYRATGSLREGTPLAIRAISPDDKAELREGFRQLSADSIYHRFFLAKTGLTDDDLRYLTELDFRRHVALVATLPVDGVERIIGVGRFIAVGPETELRRAEVAFTVGDQFQGHGVGSLLLEHLAGIARDLGLQQFEADVQADNTQMLEVFEHSGLPMTSDTRDRVCHVVLSLDAAAPREDG
jgi:GNAT superfamily N-acetyltransferase